MIRLKRLLRVILISSIYLIVIHCVRQRLKLKKTKSAQEVKSDEIKSVEESKSKSVESQCGRYPGEEDLLIDNIVWQVLVTPRGPLKLLNAYLDTRKNRSVVRVNANGILLDIFSDSIYCQFWFDDESQPEVAKATEFVIMWHLEASSDHKMPYLIECALRNSEKTPIAVSLTANRCDDARNLLKIIDNQPVDGVRKKFGVCSSIISYENRDSGFRFIEWIHILRILGADKIHFYNRFIHDDFSTVLHYMEDQGFIEMTQYIEPTEVGNDFIQFQLLQMNLINDCFYRTKNLYEHIVVLDCDEAIVPILDNDKTWSDLLNSFKKTHIYEEMPDTIVVENYFYPELGEAQFENIPKHHYMLQHIKRFIDFTNPIQTVKAIHTPDNIKVINNHFSLYCFDKLHCDVFGASANIARVNHYKNDIVEVRYDMIDDEVMWKFKDELMEAVAKTIEATSFYP